MNHQNTKTKQNRWRLPFVFFAGPILWGLQILVGYGLVTVACLSGNEWPVFLTIGLAGLIVLVAGYLAYRAHTTRSDQLLLAKIDKDQDSEIFWSLSGFAISSLFFLLILTTAVMAMFLSPCPIITMPLP